MTSPRPVRPIAVIVSAVAMAAATPGVADAAPPTDIGLSSSTVAENQPTGTAVGSLSTTDPDAGDTHTYSLVSGTGDTDNGSFQIAGDELRAATSFDFESKSSYSIRVRTTDAANETLEEVFTITVSDASEPPPATSVGTTPAQSGSTQTGSSGAGAKPGGAQVVILGFLDVQAVVSGNGFVKLNVTVPLPGGVSARDAATTTRSRAAQRRRKPLIRSTGVVARLAGTVTLTLKPSRAGEKILARTGRLRVRVLVTFNPRRGKPATFVRTVVIKPRLRRKRA